MSLWKETFVRNKNFTTVIRVSLLHSTDAERHDTSPLIGRSSPLIGHDWDSEAQLNVVMVLVTVMS